MTDSTSWLDSPAVQPGGALGVEKRAPLSAFDVVPGRLITRTSGVHRYGLDGTKGEVLSAKVATDAFEPVVVVIAPSGKRWDLSSSARTPDGGGARSPGDLLLPETGEYMLVVTSRENARMGGALTNGEYRLTLLCDAPKNAGTGVVAPVIAKQVVAKQAIAKVIPAAPPSSRSGRFAAWESEPR